MKQITLDYGTYKTELLTARQQGAEIVVGLKSKLLDIAECMKMHSAHGEYERGLRILWKLIQEIEREVE